MTEIIGMKEMKPFTYKPPGDKSISHRVAILGALSSTELEVTNFSVAKDCLTTIKCLQSMGVSIDMGSHNIKIGHIKKHNEKLLIDCENSGTTARLLPSILGGLDMEAKIVGDKSLSKRPMERLVEPLREVGAKINATDGKLPLEIKRSWKLKGKQTTLKIASAQIKSALLLASLFCEGTMEIAESKVTRDHTERMLKEFGVCLDNIDRRIIIKGKQRIKSPQKYEVAGDFSSSVYFIALGILAKEKIIEIKDVGLNPTRTAFLDIIARMGAKVNIKNNKEVNGEPIGDLEIFPGKDKLKGIQIPEELVPNLIDELPLIAIIGAFSQGITRVTGANELRVKESDRITSIVKCLKKMGVNALELPDGFEIHGGKPLRGSELFCFEDHRIIMSMTIAALFAEGTTKILDSKWVAISNNNFFDDIKKIAPGAIV